MNVQLVGWREAAFKEYKAIVEELHQEEIREHIGGVSSMLLSGQSADAAMGIHHHNALMDRLTRRRRAHHVRPALRLAEAWEDLWRERAK